MKRRLHSMEKQGKADLHKAKKIAAAKQREAEEASYYDPGGFWELEHNLKVSLYKKLWDLYKKLCSLEKYMGTQHLHLKFL